MFCSISPFNTMLMAMVEKQAGMKPEIIPYKAADQSIAALLTGDSETCGDAPTRGYSALSPSSRMKVSWSMRMCMLTEP